jgi:hypothetical protein
MLMHAARSPVQAPLFLATALVPLIVLALAVGAGASEG